MSEPRSLSMRPGVPFDGATEVPHAPGAPPGPYAGGVGVLVFVARLKGARLLTMDAPTRHPRAPQTTQVHETPVRTEGLWWSAGDALGLRYP
jgi:hypothetical protein